MPDRQVPDRTVHRDPGHDDRRRAAWPTSTSNGRPISTLTPEFNCSSARATLLGIPVPIILLGVVAILRTHLMLNNTRFGRHVYAIGGNEQAARVSGINIGRIKIRIYTFSGLLAGLGGMMLSARIGSGDPGAGHRLRARRDRGGRHRRHQLRRRHRHGLGHVVGALIIGVMNTGLDLLNVSPF